MRILVTLAMHALLLVVVGATSGAEAGSAAAVPFSVASVHLEQNVTDGDMEVVFEVTGGDGGLTELSVVAPDGRQVVVFSAPEASTLGIRQFRFESPEPRDAHSIKAAYPEGVYEFFGTSFTGDKLVGKAALTHRLPAPTTFAKPARAGDRLSAKDLAIVWRPAESVASYVVSVKQRESGASITARLPGSSTSFAVPRGFLMAGKRYDVSVGAVGHGGNTSSMETTFTIEK